MISRDLNGRPALGGIAIAWALLAAAAAPAGVTAGGGAGGSAANPSRTIRLTELRVDQQGADNDEYFELAYGSAGLPAWFTQDCRGERHFMVRSVRIGSR